MKPMFSLLKHFRQVTTRYDKVVLFSLSFVSLLSSY